MRNSQRKLIIISVMLALAAILLVGLIAAFHHTAPQKSQNNVEEGPLPIKNTGALSDLLLPKQYNAVYFDLSQFIQQKVNPRAQEATVSNVKVQPDGNITFSIAVDSLQKDAFTVFLDRSAFDKITISVTKYSYTKTIQVY